MDLVVTLSIKDSESISFKCHNVECRYGECSALIIVMLHAIMPSVFMLNVVMLSVLAPNLCR